MNTIIQLQEHLQKTSQFTDRYSLENDTKVHLLYLHPKLYAKGYYRMIAPALELSKTSSHKAIITSIVPFDFSKEYDLSSIQIDKRLLLWADYIIFPAMMQPMQYLIGAITSINPLIRCVMDIDRNYFAPPTDYTNYRWKPIEIELLQQNMSLMHLITAPSRGFAKLLQDQLDNRLENDIPEVHYLPSLVSNFGYENLPPLKKNKEQAVRIGMIKPTEIGMCDLKKVLLQIKQTFKDQVEFVILGTPHNCDLSPSFEKQIKAESHPSVSFTTYFEKLNELALDMVLLMAKEPLYHTHQHSYLFLELSTFGIPIVVSAEHSAAVHIKNGYNGLLAQNSKDWKRAITKLIKSKTLRRSLGRNALKHVWKQHSYSSKRLQYITSIFI